MRFYAVHEDNVFADLGKKDMKIAVTSYVRRSKSRPAGLRPSEKCDFQGRDLPSDGRVTPTHFTYLRTYE